MKKIWKKLMMLGITLSSMMYSTLSFAGDGDKKIDGVGVDPSKFIGRTDSAATNAVTNFGNNILGIVSTGASVLAVIILIVLGVKYMMGSAEEKAEYKKTLLPYAIGAIFVFGAGLICSILFNIAGTDWTVGE